ncbi:unnamed protein product [Arabis nemorensis]|uniref:Uncharacterized protein n=1 Tax=Arabis nemorensis TaxID=586526 RepID=A0A565B0G7_9BRAS|nr:unnamed protein product [Arabis nemorensis]
MIFLNYTLRNFNLRREPFIGRRRGNDVSTVCCSSEFERRMSLIKRKDPYRQEAARKTVPKNKLEEKALVSLPKV